jgi:hypothetical protein
MEVTTSRAGGKNSLQSSIISTDRGRL